jgi:DNA primase
MNSQCHVSKFDFSILKKRVSITDALNAYDLSDRLRTKGDQLAGPCPLHGGDNPSIFRVHRQQGLWHCFTACGGGDVVELVRCLESCTCAEAARHLVRLAEGTTSRSNRPCSLDPPACTPSFRPFVRPIPLDPQGPFLQEKKHITPAIAARFEAGYPDPRSTFLRGTAAVRLHDLRGQPLGCCGRRLEPTAIEARGKWRFPTGFPKAEVLYNAHRALAVRHRGIIVVECPWAVMRLGQAGVAGALLGTSLSPTQAAWLAQAPTVLLLFDGDEAGRKAAPLAAATLGHVTEVLTHSLPRGMEPEDLSDPQLAALAQRYLPFSLKQCSFDRTKRHQP